ncbi:nuclear transcription factor Y subunit C-4-like [Cucurbita pepo subsp. pepo]|uniref:nuclear transcription factor Y subunit C-4-like n=1 Tax=Cucurbita pepo subsp. pepo TaxID=3664 RepID=UPI000C9D32B0|nr:nuclear transcription factor Y subunit C-4-like [Cucurbita pepo subsp. pepo]
MRQAGAYSGVTYWKTGPHSLPLARIKKIMKKSGEDVKMISAEAPIVFSKACELFIEELTKRSWMIAMQSKKRMLHKEDVASAILATDIFDFLIGLIFHETTTPAASAAGDLAESETMSIPVEMRPFLQS